MKQTLNEKDMCEDILTNVKSLSSLSHRAVLESSSDHVRQVMSSIHDEQMDNAKKLFDVSKQKGWYKPEPAQPGR